MQAIHQSPRWRFQLARELSKRNQSSLAAETLPQATVAPQILRWQIAYHGNHLANSRRALTGDSSVVRRGQSCIKQFPAQ
jgi:hypothetical protein